MSIGTWFDCCVFDRFNHTSGVAVVTPTDQPKSACNRCVIEVFLVTFLCYLFAFWSFK